MKVLSPIWYIHQNNADPSRFLHIHTRKVSPPHSKHYYQHPIYFPLCNTDFKSVRFNIHVLLRDYIFTSYHAKLLSPTTPQTDARARRRHSRLPLNIHEMSWQRVPRHVLIVTQKAEPTPLNEGGTTYTPNVTNVQTFSQTCGYLQHNIYTET